MSLSPSLISRCLAASLVVLSPGVCAVAATQEAYVKASNTQYLAEFGWAVAIDGDTAVVGAKFHDGIQFDAATSDQGAAYVFVRQNGVWSQQAMLKASDAHPNGQFGIAVAIDGDRLVVGARGQAYFFKRTGTTWEQEDLAYGTNQAGILDSSFGLAVDIDGETAIVGDSNDASDNPEDEYDESATNAGAASIFVRSEDGAWQRQAYLKAAFPDGRETNPNSQGDNFGVSVSLSADTAVIGASGECSGDAANQQDNSVAASGAVYVYSRQAGVWSQSAYLKAPQKSASDAFGQSVAINGERIVVGAPGEDSAAKGLDGNAADDSAAQSGAAYLFTRSEGNWTATHYLKASNTEAGDGFGHAVAIDGDLAVVTAWYEGSSASGINGPQDNNGMMHSGAAYVFGKGSGAWAQTAYVKHSNPRAYVEFGANSVGLSGSSLIAGSHKEWSNATGINGNQANQSYSYAGAAYIFSGFSVPEDPVIITGTSFAGGWFTIDFTSIPGLGGWKVMGGSTLAAFPEDRTAESIITETSPGIYQAVVNLGASAPAHYFLRIER